MRKRNLFWLVGVLIILSGVWAFSDTVTKGLIGEQDISHYDGVNSTFTRDSSGGYTLTLNRVGGKVDALMAYGGGVNYTNATITSALTAIGTTNKTTLFLRPGTWTISANVDWSSYTNVTFEVAAGATITHTTYTINMPNLLAGPYKIFNGTGAVTLSGRIADKYSEWFGAVGDDSTDDAAAINKVLVGGGRIRFLSGKTYKVTAANLSVAASNTEFFVPTGAAIHLATTRILAVDVNNFHVRGGGKIYSTDINNSDSFPTSWAVLGMINFGATSVTPTTGFILDGMEIYQDWVGPSTYPTYGVVKTGSMDINTYRKYSGVVIVNAADVRVTNNVLHHMIGEAVVNNQGAGTVTLPSANLGHRYVGNYFYTCNHDGIAGMQTIIEDAVYSNNVFYKCLMGLEVPSGVISNNTIISPGLAGIGCGGNNVGKLSIIGNTVLYSDALGINMEETPSGTLVDAKINIIGNTVYGTAGDGIIAISNGTNTATTETAPA